MIELTLEQCRELNRSEPTPVRDPETNQTYVLISASVYAHLRALVEKEDLVDGAALMNEVMADDDARDPLLESYQHYRREA